MVFKMLYVNMLFNEIIYDTNLILLFN